MVQDLKADRRREAKLEEEKGEKEARLAEEKVKVKAVRDESEAAIRFAKEKQVPRDAQDAARVCFEGSVNGVQ
eukprot:2009233-Rhodomonas_salina.2